jgi:hypothetical protein
MPQYIPLQAEKLGRDRGPMRQASRGPYPQGRVGAPGWQYGVLAVGIFNRRGRHGGLSTEWHRRHFGGGQAAVEQNWRLWLEAARISE